MMRSLLNLFALAGALNGGAAVDPLADLPKVEPERRKRIKFGKWFPTIRVQDFPVDLVQPGDSRQGRRRKEFRAEFMAISERWGGEPRKAQRKIARARVRRERRTS